MNQRPLTLQECNQTLANVFNAFGELEIKGKQADVAMNIREALVQVNNAIVAEMTAQRDAVAKATEGQTEAQG